MSPDMADDVVQETMMEAWRHVEKLRDPQRFHAWLDGICRNVCRRYQTPDGALHRHSSLSNLAYDNETKNASDASLALPDPAAIDPAEELSQRDLATLLDRFDLVDATRKTPATYSGGMRRRLDLAMTLVGDPRIIFLDEPTTGLDPRSRHTMWQIIRDLVAGGVTILLTTQYLEEADQLADRLAVLDQGKLVAQGTPDELKRRIPGGHIRLQFADASGLELGARTLGEVTRDDNELTLQVPTDGSVRSLRAVLDRLDHEALAVNGVSVHTPDLDDVFFAITSHPDIQKGNVR